MICARPIPQTARPAATPKNTSEVCDGPSSLTLAPSPASFAARNAGTPSPVTASAKSAAAFQAGEVRLMKPGCATAQSINLTSDGDATIQAARAKNKTVPDDSPARVTRRTVARGVAPAAIP